MAESPLPELEPPSECAAWCLLTKAIVDPSVATETEPLFVAMTRTGRCERMAEPSRDVPVGWAAVVSASEEGRRQLKGHLR